jgi:hypothetical protein
MNLDWRAFKEKIAYIEMIFPTPYRILQSTALDLNFLLDVLMIKIQTSNLIPKHWIRHNFYFRFSNWECDLVLNIYSSRLSNNLFLKPYLNKSLILVPKLLDTLKLQIPTSGNTLGSLLRLFALPHISFSQTNKVFGGASLGFT